MNKSISVFMPAYNEEESIRDAVLDINHYLKTRFQDYEIIIVSEGSTDQTNDIVRGLQKEISQLHLFLKDRSFGYAGALRTGFQNSKKDLVFYTDADRQFDIKELDKLLPLLDRYDVVTGYKIKRRDPLMRLWMSAIYNLVMKLLFRVKVRDVNCAFKLFKREVIEKVNFLPGLTQGVINTEIYVSAMRNGYKIGEVPVNHYARAKGVTTAEIWPRGKFFAFVKPRIILAFMRDTFKLWRKFYL